MKLRDYQEEAVAKILEELETERSALCVLPCGTGKTEIMIEIVRQLSSSKKKIVVILNRLELFDQTLRRFEAGLSGISISSICGTRGQENAEGQIIIGTIQTLSRISDLNPSIVLLDEAHNAASPDPDSRYHRFLSMLPAWTKIIGFTATPFRVGGKIYGKDRWFKSITFQRPLPQFIEDKWLVEPKLKSSKLSFNLSGAKIQQGDWAASSLSEISSDELRVSAQVDDAFKRTGERKKLVWFCCNIAHAELVYKCIPEKAAILHSKMSMKERAFHKFRFEKTDCRHLVFVTIVSEGYDYPPVDCVVMMRPTRSAVLYVQTVGRAMRPFEGKRDCLILDYGRVIEHCGPINAPNILSMKKREAAKQLEELQAKGKFCPECDSYLLAPYPSACPECGYQFPTSISKIEDEPEEDASILLNGGLQHERLSTVRIYDHIAKSGKLFYLVKYFGMNGKAVCFEYLTKDRTNYFYGRTEARLRELGVEDQKKQDFWGKGFYSITCQPKEIYFRRNTEGFYEIKNLVFGERKTLALSSVGEGG